MTAAARTIFSILPSLKVLLDELLDGCRAGSAGGMLATARLVGQSTGAALVALFFHLFGDGAPHDTMLLAGALTICGALSSVTRLGLRPPLNER